MDFIDNSHNKTRSYKGVDIFCGVGGMSLGAMMAGIDIVLAVEVDKTAATTYKFNHPNIKIIEEDIRDIDPLKVLQESPFILFGGPPCQGFSTANTKTRTITNKNNHLFTEFIRFVLELQPKWFVFENVEGFQNFNYGKIINLLEETFEKIGYRTFSKVLCASDFGVPQNRNRFFMVGNNLEIDFKFPEPDNLKITVRDAIYDLPSLSNGASIDELPYTSDIFNDYLKIIRGSSKASLQNNVSRSKDYVIERFKHIKPGQNWRAIPIEMMKNYASLENCHSGIYKRLDPEKPSIVISNYRKNMLIHPWEDRGLSVREAARLQSFPDNFEFKGSISHQQQHIGNAVPPLLAKAIFSHIISCTHARRAKREETTTALEI